jgi:phosphoserine phosphatase RsbU/P
MRGSKFSWKFRIRTTFVVPIILLIAIAIGTVGYISFLNARAAVDDLSLQLRRELTDRTTRQMQSFIANTFTVNEINLSSFQIGEIDPNAERSHRQFFQQVKLFPFISAVYCGRDDGAFLSLGKMRKHKPLLVSTVNPSKSPWREYFLLDRDGRKGKLIERLDKIYDPRQRPWYKKAKAVGKPVWSDIYVDFNTGEPTISGSSPAFDGNGKFTGVCSIDLFLPEEFSRFLKTLKIGKSGVAYVVDRQGLMVASSANAPLFSGIGDSQKRFSAIDYNDPMVRDTAKFLRSLRGDRYGFYEFTYNQQQQLVQAVNLDDGRGLNWQLVISIPATDFTERIDANNRFTFLATLLALFCSIVFGVMVAHQITAPMLKVVAVARQISQGDRDRRVESSTISEIDSLGKALNKMADSLDDMIANLENRVRERTVQLSIANAEVISLNQRLAAENQRIGAELDILRQIQEMILPKTHELESVVALDLAGYMEPALEVGGDYYDVLTLGDRIIIGIGDVTGHGLESGVITIMVQTAVRTLLSLGETDPVKFLSAINLTIFENVKRIDSSKNLSLCLLDYHQGNLYLSGQHENVIVVRSQGEVEIIDTSDLGFPIGLIDNIEEYIYQKQIDINTGDLIILYTDGITEAENPDREFYGLERLLQLAKKHHQQTANQVRAIVIEDVRSHIGSQKVFDDITLVVIKIRFP